MVFREAGREDTRITGFRTVPDDVSAIVDHFTGFLA